MRLCVPIREDLWGAFYVLFPASARQRGDIVTPFLLELYWNYARANIVVYTFSRGKIMGVS